VSARWISRPGLANIEVQVTGRPAPQLNRRVLDVLRYLES